MKMPRVYVITVLMENGRDHVKKMAFDSVEIGCGGLIYVV